MVGFERRHKERTGENVRRLKTAVIGTGFMGKVHLEALRRVEDVDVIAVAGRQLEPAKKMAEAFKIPAAVDDYRELLADPDLDAVHICTPNASHFPIAKASLEAGRIFFARNRVAVSSREAEELAKLAEEKGLRNCVCHNLRFYPMVQQMRRMRESGELGRFWLRRGPTRRTGCSLTRTGTGESMKRRRGLRA